MGKASGQRTLGAVGALGLALALLAAPAAFADPQPPADPGIPALPVPPVEGAEAAPAAAPEPTVIPVAAPAQPDGIPHLTSPDNLPPGTTQVPPENPKLGYLRDLWHAIRTEDVSPADALLLLAQRPMDAKATPPPGLSPHPVGLPVPAVPVAPPAPAPAASTEAPGAPAADPAGAGPDPLLIGEVGQDSPPATP